MGRLGFDERWIHLMMMCVSSVSYSVLINGEPKGRIVPTRGVARNTDLGGPGCNRDISNIIFKSIGYKIINFLILLYT